MALTQSRIKELFEYEEDSGLFYRVLPPSRRNPNGKRILSNNIDNKGYVTIGVDRKCYKGHRLAWLWVTGDWPADQIDHIDGVKSNNRFSNLREATNSQNQANTPARKTNAAGLKGAHYYRPGKKWCSRIRVNGESFFLGYFDTAMAAHSAYRAATVRLNGEFGRA